VLKLKGKIFRMLCLCMDPLSALYARQNARGVACTVLQSGRAGTLTARCASTHSCLLPGMQRSGYIHTQAQQHEGKRMALALCATPLLAPWCPSMLASYVACNTCTSLLGCAAGHALAAPPLCAGRRAGLVLTLPYPTLHWSVWRRILNPSYAVSVPPSFPIQVSEAAGAATVQAGVPQRILLDYLAAHRRARGGCRAGCERARTSTMSACSWSVRA
jgi:hypothetical protein